MNFMKIFKPSKNQLILFIAMFVFSLLFFGDPYRIALCDPCDCLHRWGYPLTFMKENTMGTDINTLTCGTKVTKYIYSNLALDLIFWYLASYLLYFSIKFLKLQINRGRNIA
jgi:hypothetical protein